MPAGRPALAPRPPLPWVVVANAARARIFERDAENNALREIASHVHAASRLKGAELAADRPGRALKGAASTAFEPRTLPREREQARFAHELAGELEQAALAHRLPGWTLLASNTFLGELKSALGPAARRLLHASIALDLSSFQGDELECRVHDALRGTGGTG